MTERNAARRIEDRQRQAEEQAVETELCTVQLREERARIEAVAKAAEDYARLTPRQRPARRVARMLLVEHRPDTPADQIDPETVPLAAAQQRLSAARTTAGEIRQEAMELLGIGYHAATADDAAHEPKG
ncbi:hypothetical protein ACFRQM_43800 [Streptomyces sp. NPDC056831]|uniref:hypothetical protein n=1 Tax=Streptomyces sp. NPDC056831 TaxID=3345954 RepID=UPI00367C73B0